MTNQNPATITARAAGCIAEVATSDRVALVYRRDCTSPGEGTEGAGWTFGFYAPDGSLDPDHDLGLSEHDWQAIELALHEEIQRTGAWLPATAEEVV